VEEKESAGVTEKEGARVTGRGKHGDDRKRDKRVTEGKMRG